MLGEDRLVIETGRPSGSRNLGEERQALLWTNNMKRSLVVVVILAAAGGGSGAGDEAREVQGSGFRVQESGPGSTSLAPSPQPPAPTTHLPPSATRLSPVRPFESDADPTPHGRIDELVFGRLKQLGIAPAKVCSDGVFVRRVYLDVIGTLPTAEEARQFLDDSDPDKRRKLDRSPVGARRVRRLLGDEVVRPAAGRSRSFPSICGPMRCRPTTAGFARASRRTCRTTGSSGRCSPPAAATSARRK